MTPVNLSAQSTEQQVYTMQDQRYFELKLIRLCQRVQVNITGISVHLVEICSAGRMKTFYLQHQFQLNCRAYSYLIRGRFDSQEGNPGYQHDTQVQVSLTFCLACPSVSWDSIMISIPTPWRDENPVLSASWLGWDGERKDKAEPATPPISYQPPFLEGWTPSQSLRLMAGSLCSTCRSPGTTLLSLTSFEHHFLAENDTIITNVPILSLGILA